MDVGHKALPTKERQGVQTCFVQLLPLAQAGVLHSLYQVGLIVCREELGIEHIRLPPEQAGQHQAHKPAAGGAAKEQIIARNAQYTGNLFQNPGDVRQIPPLGGAIPPTQTGLSQMEAGVKVPQAAARQLGVPAYPLKEGPGVVLVEPSAAKDRQLSAVRDQVEQKLKHHPLIGNLIQGERTRGKTGGLQGLIGQAAGLVIEHHGAFCVGLCPGLCGRVPVLHPHLHIVSAPRTVQSH